MEEKCFSSYNAVERENMAQVKHQLVVVVSRVCIKYMIMENNVQHLGMGNIQR